MRRAEWVVICSSRIKSFIQLDGTWVWYSRRRICQSSLSHLLILIAAIFHPFFILCRQPNTKIIHVSHYPFMHIPATFTPSTTCSYNLPLSVVIMRLPRKTHAKKERCRNWLVMLCTLPLGIDNSGYLFWVTLYGRSHRNKILAKLFDIYLPWTHSAYWVQREKVYKTLHFSLMWPMNREITN